MRSFKEIIALYLDGLDEDLYYIPKGQIHTLFMALVIADIFDGNEIDQPKFKEAMRALLEAGVDPNKVGTTYKDPTNQKELATPLGLAKKRSARVYNWILNQMLEIEGNKGSATESVAFEGKVSDWFKNRFGIKLPSRMKLKDINAKAAELEKTLEPDLNPVKEDKYGKPIEDKGQLDKLAEWVKIKSLPEKKIWLIDNLGLSGEFNDPNKSPGSDSILTALAKERNPFEADLTKVLLKRPGAISKKVGDLLVNQRFEGLDSVLASKGTAGLNPFNSDTGFDQLKVIAFFIYKNWNTDDLREGGKWKSSVGMKNFVSKMGSSYFSPGKKKAATPERLALSDEIRSWLKKLDPRSKTRVNTDIDTPEEVSELAATFSIKLSPEKITFQNLKSAPVYKEGGFFDNFVAEAERLRKLKGAKS